MTVTLYNVFDQLLAQYHVQILDSPDKCKVVLRRHGFSENNLEVRLFFVLLDKNVPLEARKTTYSNKNFTSYSLSIFLYTKIFGMEKLPNEYESILLKQTGLIVDVLVQEQIIHLDFLKKIHKEKCRDFYSALNNIIQLYGTEILLDTKKLNAVFRDIAEFDDINNDINHFLPILENLNKGEVDFSHETIKYYLKMLHEVISKQNKLYTPLPKAYNAYLKKLKELQQKQQEQYAVFLKKQEEVKIQYNAYLKKLEEEKRQERHAAYQKKLEVEQEEKRQKEQTKRKRNIYIVFVVLIYTMLLFLAGMRFPVFFALMLCSLPFDIILLLEVFNEPHKPRKKSSMTNQDIVEQFLRTNRHEYCDDCLSELCKVYPRQQIYQICSYRSSIIKRHDSGICFQCGSKKITRSIKE